MSHSFPAKILLFGEYGIIKGSKGIAIPLNSHYGQLVHADSASEISQKLKLDEFHQYLVESSLLSKAMDLNAFETDINSGCFFHSNIPQGYGIGSSGALCAAVFDKYAHNFERKDIYSNDELKYLKDMMALMESFYHGSSSGLDCLISLINLPCMIENRNKVSIIQKPSLESFGQFYLYDSGNARTTSAFVHDFLENYDRNSEYKMNINTFIDTTEKIIDSLLSGKIESFDKTFYELSRLQYLHFSQMIPERIKSLWLKGLETKEYYFKLCGAGGGGFFLVYSNKESFRKTVSSDYIRVDHV